jgi:hypothetical protein
LGLMHVDVVVVVELAVTRVTRNQPQLT